MAVISWILVRQKDTVYTPADSQLHHPVSIYWVGGIHLMCSPTRFLLKAERSRLCSTTVSIFFSLSKSFTRRLLVRVRLDPWLSSYEKSPTATSPKVSWLPNALHHPALSHATLLASAVHLARMQRSTDLWVALWYKGQAIRRVNEGLDIREESVSDQMILVVLILLYFTASDSTCLCHGGLIASRSAETTVENTAHI